MAKNKTNETSQSVTNFVNQVENEIRRNDSFKLIEVFKSITGFDPKMWGPSIIGFGTYHYTSMSWKPLPGTLSQLWGNNTKSRYNFV